WHFLGLLPLRASPIEFLLDALRLFTNHLDEWLFILGDHHDAPLADSVAPAILFFVVTDTRPARDEHVAIDDRSANPRMTPDPHPGHENALLDFAETVHPDIGTENAAADRAPGHDAACRDDRVERPPAAASFVGEYELGRRRLHLVRVQRPLRVVQVELRVDLTEIHVGFEVGIERADVAPVLRELLVLVEKPIRVDWHLRH